MQLYGSDKLASFISLCTKPVSHRPCSLLSVCSYYVFLLTTLFRILCHLAGYLRFCKMPVTGQEKDLWYLEEVARHLC